MTDLLLVYGTFRRGFGRHGVLERLRARYVGEGTVQGELFNLGEFPGARKSDRATGRIVGEVYALQNPTRAFQTLDQVEGFRSTDPVAGLFRRETAEVALENGRRVTAWVYWLSRVPWPASRIPSGDYARG